MLIPVMSLSTNRTRVIHRPLWLGDFPLSQGRENCPPDPRRHGLFDTICRQLDLLIPVFIEPKLHQMLAFISFLTYFRHRSPLNAIVLPSALHHTTPSEGI